jgi:tRNA (adenine37-N6)-methyltransferase
MSRGLSCAVVGILSFVAGALLFWQPTPQEKGSAALQSARRGEAGQAAIAAIRREFVIEGMSCPSCALSVTMALKKIPGVESASVSLQDKRAVVLAGAQVPAETIVAAIAAAGYQARLVPADKSTTAATTNSGKQSGPKMEKSITMEPIGIIHSPYKEAKGTPIQGVFDDATEAWVELGTEYVKGLKDLSGFSHAILLYHFHHSDRVEIVGKPYLEKEDHGIFAIRSPHRPNHIGLSVVRIKRIEGNKLYFTEVDVLDGTPVLDIKPYVRQFDSREKAVSGWIERHYKGGKLPEHKTAE